MTASRSIAALIALAGGIAGGLPARAAEELYVFDRAHSSVEFKIRHLFSRVSGRFTEFSGEIRIDPKAPETASVTAAIATASVNTDNADRDKHLRAADFFDATNYPAITFASRKVVRTGPNEADVTGDLTLRGVKREVLLRVRHMGHGPDGWGGYRSGWSIDTQIDRTAYGITNNKIVDGTKMIGDEVDIHMEIEALRKEPAAGIEAPPR